MDKDELVIEKLLNDIELQRLGYHLDGTALYDEGEEEDFEHCDCDIKTF